MATNDDEKLDEKVILPRNMRRFREEIGITQFELASQAGIGIATVNRIEKGHNMPDVTTLRAIARVIGRSLDDFVNPDPPPPDPSRQPAVRFKIVAENLDDDLRRRTQDFLDGINREYQERVRAARERMMQPRRRR